MGLRTEETGNSRLRGMGGRAGFRGYLAFGPVPGRSPAIPTSSLYVLPRSTGPNPDALEYAPSCMVRPTWHSRLPPARRLQ